MKTRTIWIVCAPIRRLSLLAGVCLKAARTCVRSRRCRGWRTRLRSIRLTYALVDQWVASYEREPVSVILDIDDTCDVVHGHQQLSLFNAHYDERCFLPIHVYDTEHSPPVALVLRPGRAVSESCDHGIVLHRR
jgi:hypothetical protein